MAVELTTTLGARRAVNPFSRRQLLGGAVLAVLTGAAVGGAIVLPDPGETFPAQAEATAFSKRISRSLAAAPPGQTVDAWARTSTEGQLLLLMRRLTPEQQEVFLRAGRRMASGMPPREAVLLCFQESGMSKVEVAQAMAALPMPAGEA